MAQDDAAEHEKRKADDNAQPKPSTAAWYAHPGFGFVALAFAIFLGAFITLYGGFDKPPEWAKFWVPHMINVVLLLAFIYQAFINTRQ